MLKSLLLALAVTVAACRPTPGKPPLPGSTAQALPAATVTVLPPRVTTPAPTRPPIVPPRPATATPFPAQQVPPGRFGAPTLADLWAGHAEFVVDAPDTGLPMGESDTVIMNNGEVWSYLHASQRSAGAVDRCGDPVPFPGCTVIYRSYDGGVSFGSERPPLCQFGCLTCPCDNAVDHIEQQQYPRVFFDGEQVHLVYEWQGRVMLRTSPNGVHWSPPEYVGDTLIWNLWYRDCPAAERIGEHPNTPMTYECLAGGPPGIYVDDGTVYVFVALGQNPGAMGCFQAPVGAPGSEFRRCAANPLFVGAPFYGPTDLTGPATNPYFDFRTISSADVIKIDAGDDARYYMLYEGVRGPGPGDPGDTQFGLGMARSLTSQIDGPWEKYPHNPLLANLPGNIGLGHADIVVAGGWTHVYTSLDGVTRSRLTLVWKG
ncbi:MAG: hypothetical protein IPK16_08020 [Anaerolineales bacterium]|nr:hypothetical protein [Anaerolineales bacterium]